MKFRQTAEVAALVSQRANEIIDRPEPISTAGLHGYWKSSRVRLRCWFAALRSTSPSPLLSPQQLHDLVGASRSILVAELLTRVWSTVLVARAQRKSESAPGELARNVYQGQQEARREVLKLLADEERLSMSEASSLDQLRRKVERWTDVLIGPLLAQYDVAEFAFDADRARELSATGPASLATTGTRDAASRLTLIGLSQAIPPGPGSDCVGASLDTAVAQSVLRAMLHVSTDRDDHEAVDLDCRTDAMLLPPGPVRVPRHATALTSGIRFAEIRRRDRR